MMQGTIAEREWHGNAQADAMAARASLGDDVREGVRVVLEQRVERMVHVVSMVQTMVVSILRAMSCVSKGSAVCKLFGRGAMGGRQPVVIAAPLPPPGSEPEELRGVSADARARDAQRPGGGWQDRLGQFMTQHPWTMSPH
eukprot:15454610-Alexandrium_andersonii.AAC.1